MRYHALAFNEMNEDEIRTNDFNEVRGFSKCYGKSRNNIVIVWENGKEIFYKGIGERVI